MEPLLLKVNFGCPKCNSRSCVYDSKHKPKINGRLRYRKCTSCSYVFKTIQYGMEAESIYESSRKSSVRFTPKDILNIRHSYWEKGVSSVALARQYDCAKTSITRIINNKVHAHIK